LALAFLAIATGILIAHGLNQASLEKSLSQDLGRQVTIGKANIDWHNAIHMEMKNFRLANADWGSQPDMIRLGVVEADISVWPLLRGVIEYQNLQAQDFEILLERDKNGIGNWRMDGKLPAKDAPVPHGGLTVVPKNRTQFPNLLNFTLQHGKLSLRVSSGKLLHLTADDLKASAADGDAPMQMIFKGTYNDVKTHIEIKGDSFEKLRNDSMPYGMKILINTPHNQLLFDGTSMNPLDMDAAKGDLKITTDNFGDLLGILDMQSPAKINFEIGGYLNRNGDDWDLSSLHSKLSGNEFDGHLVLHEGARAQADTIAMDLNAGQVNAKKIYDSFGATGFVQSNSFTAKPGTKFDARLQARDIQYGQHHIYDSQSHLTLRPGDMRLEIPVAKFLDANMKITGSISAKDDNHLNYHLNADLSQGKMGKLMQFIDLKPGSISGLFNLYADITMMGKNWHDSLRTAYGQAGFVVKNGTIAQDNLEKLSLDLRSLFRTNNGQVPLNCLAAHITVHNGIGEILPLLLDTRGADFVGQGNVNLARQYLDIILQSNPDSTSDFALDVPLRLTGPFSNLHIAPAFGAELPKMKEADCAL